MNKKSEIVDMLAARLQDALTKHDPEIFLNCLIVAEAAVYLRKLIDDSDTVLCKKLSIVFSIAATIINRAHIEIEVNFRDGMEEELDELFNQIEGGAIHESIRKHSKAH